MTAGPTEGVRTPLTAEDAFSTLGSDIRIGILEALGEAGGPLPFSELRSAVGVADSGQFNYHLDKLERKFVAESDAGYRLLESGRRVVEAIYSGVLTDAPDIDRIQIDRPCRYCGAPIEVRVQPGAITSFCTSCPGTFGESTVPGSPEPAERGYLGKMSLPPAGFNGRSADEIYRAAQVWTHLEFLSLSNRVCPRCSARVDLDVQVCGDHDPADEGCEACGNRQPTMLEWRCTNCIFDGRGDIGILLYSHPAVQAFQVGHGEDLVAPAGSESPLANQVQEVASVDPFSARVTYRYDGETLTMAIDEDLTVVEVTEQRG